MVCVFIFKDKDLWRLIIFFDFPTKEYDFRWSVGLTTLFLKTYFLSKGQKVHDDVLTVARRNGGNMFVDLLWVTGLAQTIMTSSGKITLIVPTDHVFRIISQSMQKKLQNTCVLRNVLRHHIVKEQFSLENTRTNGIILSDGKKPIIFTKFKVYKDVFPGVEIN